MNGRPRIQGESVAPVWTGKGSSVPVGPAHASHTTCVTGRLVTFWRSPQPWTPASQLTLSFLVTAILTIPGRIWDIVLPWPVYRQAPHLESVLVPQPSFWPSTMLLVLVRSKDSLSKYPCQLLHVAASFCMSENGRDIKAKQMTDRAVSTFKCCFSRCSPNPSVCPSISNPGRNVPWEAVPTVECYYPKTKMNDWQRMSVGDILHPCAMSFINNMNKQSFCQGWFTFMLGNVAIEMDNYIFLILAQLQLWNVFIMGVLLKTPL